MARRMLAGWALWLGCALLMGCDRTRPVGTPAVVPVRGEVSEEFLALMNAGKNHLDQADATNALAVYGRARELVPTDPDVHLNLANAHLLAGAHAEAVGAADEVLLRDPNSAAAYFVRGSALLRAGQAEEAVKAFENVRRIDPGEIATYFQMGKARMDLRQWDEAAAAFREGLALDPNHLHATARYLLGQSLLRAGKTEEARKELEEHAVGVDADAVGGSATAASFERSKFTVARVPFRLEQPDPAGIPVRFTEATGEAFGAESTNYSGPVAVVDPDRSGVNRLLVRQGAENFRLLSNSNGVFRPWGLSVRARSGAAHRAMLVGDLQNDRLDEVVVLGERGIQVLQVGTNGVLAEVTMASRLGGVVALDGALADPDFTGKLDLYVIGAEDRTLRVFRQFGPLSFADHTTNAGLAALGRGLRSVEFDDWNRDGTPDLILARETGIGWLGEKQRGGKVVVRESGSWVAGAVVCSGDFDNDLRPDLAVVGAGEITICLEGGQRRSMPFPQAADCRRLLAFDHDNDGWLDLWAVGDSLRVWRNVGLSGFREDTAALGLDRFRPGAILSVHVADFDADCDSDVVVALVGGGLRYLRNDGGDANRMVKVQLIGNRSNASGLGCKVEIESGGLRVLRAVQRLPVEVGVGQRETMDSFMVHWFNWPQGSTAMPVNCHEPVLALEATVQEGSCPYLYAWDGERFRFVTDILGAAPLGLPMAAGRYIEADPEELVWLGDERTLRPKDGEYRLVITEELREVLYLDEAKLVVVDLEPGVEVQATDKLLPGPPYPPGRLLSLRSERPLLRAEGPRGQDVTERLRAVDGRRVSPERLRAPQLRGLAEPHSITLDFGPLASDRRWVLVLNGWLRFGGGMANIAASHDPDLPYPFPTLEAEVEPDVWRPVEVPVGAPAGKTKTIVVELAGRLPPGAGRLRLTQAFEIHWDRIALLEELEQPRTRVSWIDPASADLGFHGFGRLLDLPADAPPTPDFQEVEVNSRWTVVPGGWSTRYGDVLELVSRRDEGLVLVHSGDALTLGFSVGALPPKPEGWRREFFLYADGWDKDSDFHVQRGAEVEPLPWHGMDDQRYGSEPRPPFPSDALHRRFNTRWVDAGALRRRVGAGVTVGSRAVR